MADKLLWDDDKYLENKNQHLEDYLNTPTQSTENRYKKLDIDYDDIKQSVYNLGKKNPDYQHFFPDGITQETGFVLKHQFDAFYNGYTNQSPDSIISVNNIRKIQSSTVQNEVRNLLKERKLSGILTDTKNTTQDNILSFSKLGLIDLNEKGKNLSPKNEDKIITNNEAYSFKTKMENEPVMKALEAEKELENKRKENSEKTQVETSSKSGTSNEDLREWNAKLIEELRAMGAFTDSNSFKSATINTSSSKGEQENNKSETEEKENVSEKQSENTSENNSTTTLPKTNNKSKDSALVAAGVAAGIAAKNQIDKNREKKKAEEEINNKGTQDTQKSFEESIQGLSNSNVLKDAQTQIAQVQGQPVQGQTEIQQNQGQQVQVQPEVQQNQGQQVQIQPEVQQNQGQQVQIQPEQSQPVKQDQGQSTKSQNSNNKKGFKVDYNKRKELEKKEYNLIKATEQKTNFVNVENNLKNATFLSDKAEKEFVKKGNKATQKDYENKELLIARKNAYIKLSQEVKIPKIPVKTLEQQQKEQQQKKSQIKPVDKFNKFIKDPSTYDQFRYNQKVAVNKENEFKKLLSENANKLATAEEILSKAPHITNKVYKPNEKKDPNDIYRYKENGNYKEGTITQDKIKWARDFKIKYTEWQNSQDFYNKQARIFEKKAEDITINSKSENITKQVNGLA